MKSLLNILFRLLLFSFFTACTIMPNNNDSSGSSGDNGSMNLVLSQDGVSKTLVPAISMDITSFTISFSGPNGTNFSTNTTASNISLTRLPIGNWNITVAANNSNNTVIGAGSASTLVRTGVTSTVSIIVTPLNGLGTLNLLVNWNSVDLAVPQLFGTLINIAGSNITLQFSTNSNSGTCVTNNINSGYYAMIVTLKDNNILVAGAVEVVRILSNQITFGTFNFTNANQPGGSIDINIIANLGNPIDVTLSGQTNIILTNQPMTVLASVPAGTGGVTDIWYINGVQQGAGSNITINITNAGYYRLDVIVFTAGAARAGSATYSFYVVNAISHSPAPVDIGTATNFAVLAESGISTTSPCAITGNIGLSPVGSSAITGFGLVLDISGEFSLSSQVTGRIYAADYSNPTPAMLVLATNNMLSAYNDAALRTQPFITNLGNGEIGGMTLPAALYKWPAAVSISSNLILNGGPNDIWIFQVTGALTTGTGVYVTLTGGAQAKNVFWQTVSAGLGASSHFEGIVLASTSITLGTGASVNGRLLSQAAVSLNSNIIIQP